MRFGIKNLGPIKDANIEIGDLTIICGKNNCGKTYLTYSIYIFLTKFCAISNGIIRKISFSNRSASTSALADPI